MPFRGFRPPGLREGLTSKSSWHRAQGTHCVCLRRHCSAGSVLLCRDTPSSQRPHLYSRKPPYSQRASERPHHVPGTGKEEATRVQVLTKSSESIRWGRTSTRPPRHTGRPHSSAHICTHDLQHRSQPCLWAHSILQGALGYLTCPVPQPLWPTLQGQLCHRGLKEWASSLLRPRTPAVG